MTECTGDGLCFSDALLTVSLEPKARSITRYRTSAAPCPAKLVRWELPLTVQHCQEPFEGCGLPVILSAQVLSALPQPSQRQQKGIFCFLSASSEIPTPAARQVASGEGCCSHRWEGKQLTSQRMHPQPDGDLDCSRCTTGSEEEIIFHVSLYVNVGSNSSLPTSKAG